MRRTFPYWPAGLLLLSGCILTQGGNTSDGHTTPGDVVSSWQPSAQHQARSASAEHPAPPPGPREAGMSEQVALMSQRLAANEDDRKVLAGRLEMLENQLAEKDRALTQANREVQEATEQIARTRRELQSWKQDMSALRDRLGSAEKDNRATLESIIHTLEQILQRDQEGRPGPALYGPDLPRPP
jgi:chromosome segregation ATPase